MSVRRTVAVSASVVVSLVLLTGCRTDVDVRVAVRPGGSGTVAVTVDLDADAADHLGDPKRLALDDMRTAGWRVTGPIARGRALRLVAVRPFGSPDQLAAVMEEIGGDRGVFRGTSLRLSDGFAHSSTRFRTSLHLQGDLSELSDPKLTTLLGGLPLGRTAEELAASGLNSPDAGRLTVRVLLPGGVDSSNGTVTGGVARWSVPLSGGSTTAERLTASAQERRNGTFLLVGAGVVMLVAAAALAASASRRAHAG